jgi:hypothetical protein
MAQLAQSCGVKAGLYHYFEAKEALLFRGARPARPACSR